MTQRLNTDNGLQGRWTNTTGYNSTYPKGGVSCSKDSFVVNQTLVFQIKFCGKSPALRVAANRCVPGGTQLRNTEILLLRAHGTTFAADRFNAGRASIEKHVYFSLQLTAHVGR